jgi:hypothetical protein
MNKTQKAVPAITKCPLHSALYILNQGAHREPVLCLGASTAAKECSTFMCFDLRYCEKLLSHSHTGTAWCHRVALLAGRSIGALWVTNHFSARETCQCIDRILIGNAEVYVPTRRPDTNCASLTNYSSTAVQCKLQCELVQSASCCGLCRRKK